MNETEKNPVETFFLMMMGSEITSGVKRPTAVFHEPDNVSQAVTYYSNILNNLSNDPLFGGIAAQIQAAQAQLATLLTAETKMAQGTKGLKQDRDKELLASRILMDGILSEAQKAADADLENAVLILTRNGIDIRGYTPHVYAEVEAKDTNEDGVIEVFHKALKGHTAYLWMISRDGQSWEFGAFSKNRKGTIRNLKPGELLYIKAMTHSGEGYSGWSQIITFRVR